MNKNNPKIDYEAQRNFVEMVNRAGGTYHQLDMGNGLIIKGDYDMNKYIDLYNLPDRLDKKRVLDIGTAAGYFAIECLRRGGQVTAIDIYDETCLLYGLIKSFYLEITYVQKSIYDLDSEFGQYDLVICGSLLLHLPDPFSAIRHMRSICSNQMIISTACTSDSETNPLALCEFIGQHAAEADYWLYWKLSAQAIKKMAFAAGFSRIESIQHFSLQTEKGRPYFDIPHVVLSAFV